jgi:hypothetical protein
MTYKFTAASLPLDLWMYKQNAGISTTKIVQKVLKDLRDFGRSQVRLKEVLTAAKLREIRKQDKQAKAVS